MFCLIPNSEKVAARRFIVVPPPILLNVFGSVTHTASKPSHFYFEIFRLSSGFCGEQERYTV